MSLWSLEAGTPRRLFSSQPVFPVSFLLSFVKFLVLRQGRCILDVTASGLERSRIKVAKGRQIAR